ncbi:hydrocephalus-inducing protein homolog isoform X1 [Tachysurus ichikawai]
MKSLVMGIGSEAELEPYGLGSTGGELLYSGHPQRATVALREKVHFPNLHFSSHVLDFGCILNCTKVQKQLTMTNSSSLPVIYRWAFMLDQQHYCIRFSKIFDIMPTYEIALKGEASLITCILDTTEIKFGPQTMTARGGREVECFLYPFQTEGTSVIADKLLLPNPSQTYLLPYGTEDSENELAIELIGDICISISKKEEARIDMLLSSMKLPSLDEVFQDVGCIEKMCLSPQLKD